MYNRIEVFYAYAPEDETWVHELEKHLSSLARQGLISTWHPRLIAAGEDWQHVIDVHFQRASLILLLISPDFLSSDYCYTQQPAHTTACTQKILNVRWIGREGLKASYFGK